MPGLEPCQGWSPARGGALPGLEPCQGWSPDPPPPAPPPTPPPHPLALPPVLPRLASPRPARAKTPPAKTLKSQCFIAPPWGTSWGTSQGRTRMNNVFPQALPKGSGAACARAILKTGLLQPWPPPRGGCCKVLDGAPLYNTNLGRVVTLHTSGALIPAPRPWSRPISGR